MVNFNSIARDAGLPSRTVQSYYEILEDTLITIRIDGWRKSVRKRLMGHPKYYLFDVGVTNALCRRFGVTADPFIKGRLFEQWLILETYRYLSYFNQEIRLFYWRTSAGAEVDLIFEHGGKILAACEFKSGKTVGRQHLRGLSSFAEDHPDALRYLVCDCRMPFIEKGVEILPWNVYLKKLAENSILHRARF